LRKQSRKFSFNFGNAGFLPEKQASQKRRLKQYMAKKVIDPGFGEKYTAQTKRIINPDGSVNVVRRNTEVGIRDLYQYLINMRWRYFLLLVILFYLFVNLLFSGLYYLAGIENLKGIPDGRILLQFLNVYFFSVQTLTTVGYGGILPAGIPANIVASIEAMSGWLFFALTTGLLYGRFSRPVSRILFSRNALIVPGEKFNRLMFRIVNQRSNMILDLKAKVLVMFIDKSNGQHNRQYFNLALERSEVSFFPMNWTIVHEINEDSPLFRKSAQELAALETELLILVNGFDDTFNQILHTRYSYRHEEFIWGARFKRAYEIDAEGNVVVDMVWLHEFEKEALKPMEAPEDASA
jgi:inward rectifier potassium channel